MIARLKRHDNRAVITWTVLALGVGGLVQAFQAVVGG